MFLEVQEQVHRKVMEVDFFSAWILTHDTLPGKGRSDLKVPL